MEKQVVSIRINPNLYQQLKSEVGRGRISAFIEKLISKELSEQDQKLAQAYKECYSNPRMLKEAKQWEKAGIETWLNYEKGLYRKKSASKKTK
jgi:hypothetical protein